MTEKQKIREIKLKPGIYNFIPQLGEYIINGKELEPEIENILSIYKTDYSIDEAIQERGRDKIIARFIQVSSDFDFEVISSAVNAGLAKAQTLNPAVAMKDIPVVFLYFPNNEGAKSLHTQGCAININEFCGKGISNERKIKKVQSNVAHEAVHVFLEQLGVRPSDKWFNMKTFIWDFLWEEGLTTTMEIDYEDYHYSFIEDAEFYITLIQDWINLEREDPKKEDLIQKCINRPSFLNWLEQVNTTLENIIPDTDDIDKKFIFLLKSFNGFGYHIGNVLWQRQLDNGLNLTELVMKGSGEMNKWLENYKKSD